MQGFIRTTEGLIYKTMLDGKPSPWLLYKRSWGEYRLIGKTTQRPTASDLELALYNSSASESPVVKGGQIHCNCISFSALQFMGAANVPLTIDRHYRSLQSRSQPCGAGLLTAPMGKV